MESLGALVVLEVSSGLLPTVVKERCFITRIFCWKKTCCLLVTRSKISICYSKVSFNVGFRLLHLPVYCTRVKKIINESFINKFSVGLL